MITTAFALITLAAPVTIDSAAPLAPNRDVRAPRSAASIVVGTDTVATLLQHGTSLIARERYQEARDVFRTAARLHTISGRSPVAALRQIADTYYFAGDLRRAVSALTEVADSAASYGDLAMQADALVDIAAVQVQLGDATRADRARERALRLTSSPYMPADRAATLRTRLATR